MPTTKTAVVDNKVSDKEIADAARAFFRLLAMQSPTIAKVAKAAAVEAVEDVDDEDTPEEELPMLDPDEVEALGIKELRELAKQYGLSVTKKQEIYDGLSEFFPEEDDEEIEDVDDDEEEDDDEVEAESLDRDELSELSLKELREEAKSNGHTAAEYRGMDQDALIDLILGEGVEDEEDDEEEADEEEEDEDVEELDEDALKAMSLTELRNLAKEIDLKVKMPVAAKTTAAKQKVYVNAILDSAEE